jgi:thiamine biosynthesis protein ThiS
MRWRASTSRFLVDGPPRPHSQGMDDLLRVTLNGESKAFDRPLTVADLLRHVGLDTGKVAVERNAEIVPRSVHADTWLVSGDSLEIVHFIGGG